MVRIWDYPFGGARRTAGVTLPSQHLDLEIDRVEDKLVASESGGKANTPRRRAVVVLRVWQAPVLARVPSQVTHSAHRQPSRDCC